MNHISDIEFFFIAVFFPVCAVSDMRDEGVKCASRLMCEVTMPQ